jgi:hypothetical protein
MRHVLYTIAFAAGSLASAASAQTPGACALGTAQRELDVSYVRAVLFNTGSLFFGNAVSAGYLAPASEDRSPVYAAGLWFAGLVGGDLRVAAATYQNFEFWPGPLNPGATLPNPTDCSAYDRIWVVSAADVAAYEAGGAPTADLAEWPAALGAEVVDGDGTPGNYDLAGGDRPQIYGSQTAFWVMNDVGNTHANMETRPIGLEVRVHAFAVDDPAQPALDQGTFYRYTLVNRNTQAFTEARVGIWMDPDLGDAADDYVGSDPARGLMYVYNADNADGNGLPPTYGANPPAAGVDFLPGIGTLMYNTNSPGPTSDPDSAQHVHNYLRGLWRDGTPLTTGGTGYNPGSTDVTPYAFSGDPVAGSFWSERCPGQPCGTANFSGDRRFVGATGFSLEPGETQTFDFAILFARGTSNLDSITRLRQASDLVQNLYGGGTLYPQAQHPPVAGEGGPEAARFALVAAPNPAAGRAAVTFALPEAADVRLVAYDVLGRAVGVLAEGARSAGAHTAVFEAGRLPAGPYLLVLEAGGHRAVARVTVAR